MSEAALDPYAVLGVAHDVSDIELRRVYRRLVKRYHPDHNGGSAESAARFAQIQNAYDAIAHHRTPPQAAQPPHGTAGTAAAAGAAGSSGAQHGAGDPGIEDRIATLEHEMAAMREAEQRRAEEQARAARERARRVAENVAAAGANQAQRGRPTPEELGYYTTDDSFTKIIDDAADQLGERIRKSDAKRQFSRRLSDLFGRED
jgi:curved DNA-binding protein CbpA